MIEASGLDREQITKQFIENYLRLGRCIILLDALDEVPKENRRAFHRKLISFFSVYNPNNKICITSRDRGFIPQGKTEVLHISPLTLQDINDYLDKMILLGKFSAIEKKRFMRQAAVLIRKRFLDSFLVLSLLVNIYRAERELPSNKVELYKRCFEYIYKKREKDKNTSYNWGRLSAIMKESTFISLSLLAAPNNHNIAKALISKTLLTIYCKRFSSEIEAEAAVDEFLDYCSSRTELLVPSDADEEYHFFHRSFFEYFYSRYLNQDLPIDKIYLILQDYDTDSEVFELLVAILKEENELKYQGLIDYVFQIVTDSCKVGQPNVNAFQILTLMMRVVDDSIYIRDYFDVFIEVYKNANNTHSDNTHSDMQIMYIASRQANKAVQLFPDKKVLLLHAFSATFFCSIFAFSYKISRNPNAVSLFSEPEKEVFFTPLFDEYIDYSQKRSSIILSSYLAHMLTECLTIEYIDSCAQNWDSSIYIGKVSNLTTKRKASLLQIGCSYFRELLPENKQKIIDLFNGPFRIR